MPSRSVFITGASSGLGAALARRYAAEDRVVGLFARRRAELDALAAALPAGRAAVYEGDVRDADALARAAADFIARFGAPEIVIANAGISRGALTEREEDLPTFRAVFDTNVLGLVHTFRPFIASMQAAGGGALVGIASIAGFRGLPGSATVFRVEGRGHRLPREPARRAAGRRCRGAHGLPRLYRDGDDREESLCDAVPARRGRSGAADRPRHRTPQALLRAAVADGDRRARALACCRARSTTRFSRTRRASRGGPGEKSLPPPAGTRC